MILNFGKEGYNENQKGHYILPCIPSMVLEKQKSFGRDLTLAGALTIIIPCMFSGGFIGTLHNQDHQSITQLAFPTFNSTISYIHG